MFKVIGDVDQVTRFNQLPLSAKTIAGLERGHFMNMTPVQKQSLLYSLCGKDILGAAKTGSGKTLAFLVPVLERLYLENWTVRDGLGALILSPTRELALQIFEVLRKIGIKHGLSAGLVIGGKDLKSEREAINRMNILVATPGRLLQHMDQTSGFVWDNLQVLVLDEADRILDMGFARTVDAVLKSLPRNRQTLLFSATQTSSVKDLARVSLKSPHMVSLCSGEDSSTPSQLKQHYIITSLPDKLDRLLTFIKGHTSSKGLVFLSSCKQVRFVYESFCKLQPGAPLLCLHGKQKQVKRMNIFYEFCQKKDAFLFCTDIAARGLDFPAVDWVIQVDCPEDADTYIHRVGRTARYESAGNGILFLLPSEAPEMLKQLEAKKVPMTLLSSEARSVKPRWNLTSHLQSQCSSDPEIKYLAQKTLVSYVRSIHLQHNKKIFKVSELPLDEFARSLGLPGTPKLRFISKSTTKNVSRELLKEQNITPAVLPREASSDSEIEEDDSNNNTTKQIRKIDKMFKKKNLNVLSDHYAKLREKDETAPQNENDSSDDDLLTIKRTDHEIKEDDLPSVTGAALKPARRDILKTKKRYKIKAAAKSISTAPKKLIFDDDGEAEEAFPYEKESSFDRNEAENMATEFTSKSLSVMQEADVEDRARERDRLREKKAIKKRKIKARENESDDNQSGAPCLPSGSDSD